MEIIEKSLGLMVGIHVVKWSVFSEFKTTWKQIYVQINVVNITQI